MTVILEDQRLHNSVFADVFVPDVGILRNVVREHVDAIFGVEVDDFGAIFTEPSEAGAEVDGLGDDHSADGELAYQAAAIPAGSERGHHDLVAVTTLAAGLSKGVRFAMRGGIAFLHSAVVAASEKFSIAFEKRGADGNPAFGEPEPSFFHSHFQHSEIHLAVFV